MKQDPKPLGAEARRAKAASYNPSASVMNSVVFSFRK
jgi:hypothetical protein